MTSHELLQMFLILHGLVGGFDVLVNHELVEHLPARQPARLEVALHSAREALFAILFFGLAWWEWHGAWAWAIAAVAVIEMAVTTVDVLLENRTRHLSQTELVSHLILLVNYGVIAALLAASVLQWQGLPSALVETSHGWRSGVLSGLALAGALWSVRDAIAAFRLERNACRDTAQSGVLRHASVTGKSDAAG